MAQFRQFEWNRVAVLVATVAVLFFFTRPAPFPGTTFWELMLARDFDLTIGMAFPPEIIALNIVNSSASLLGLKAFYHIVYFILNCILCVWVFKNREILPGLIALAIFALSMQSFLNLRMLLQLIFVIGLLTILENNRLTEHCGIVLIPITAVASALTLNSWLMLVLIICHAFLNKNYSLSLIFCGLVGVLLFPEGAAEAVNTNSVLAWRFYPPSDLKVMYLLAGIFLLVNIITFKRLTYEDFPNLLFYAITGFLALINPDNIPLFIMIGLVMILKSCSNLKPMPLNMNLVGIVVLIAIIHLFTFVNPFGMNLNPSVRGQIGKNLSLILDGYTNELELINHELGEIAWKGMIRLQLEDLQTVLKFKKWRLVKLDNGEYEIQPKLTSQLPIVGTEVSVPDQI